VNNQTVENWTELFFLDTGYHGTIYGIVYHTIMYAVFGVILEKKASSSYIIYHISHITVKGELAAYLLYPRVLAWLILRALLLPSPSPRSF
jgi:hypothetical protein